MAYESLNDYFPVVEFPSNRTLPREFLRYFENVGLSIRQLKLSPHNANHYEIHRQKSSIAFENSLAELSSRDSALVLGSGNLIDVPVTVLLQEFDQVSFVDLDTNSTQMALNALPQENKLNVVQLINEDITGTYAQLLENIDIIIGKSTLFEQALNAVAEYFANYKPDMEPVAQLLGRDKYDFVSSSFLISQLHVVIHEHLTILLFKKYKSRLDQSNITPGSIVEKYFYSTTKLSRVLQFYHFELLAKLIKPEGILHFACTPDVMYFTRDDNNQIVPGAQVAMLDQEFVGNTINLSFTPITSKQTQWAYFKSNPTISNPQGEIFNAISSPYRVKLNEMDEKNDSYTD